MEGGLWSNGGNRKQHTAAEFGLVRRAAGGDTPGHGGPQGGDAGTPLAPATSVKERERSPQTRDESGSAEKSSLPEL